MEEEGADVPLARDVCVRVADQKHCVPALEPGLSHATEREELSVHVVHGPLREQAAADIAVVGLRRRARHTLRLVMRVALQRLLRLVGTWDIIVEDGHSGGEAERAAVA